MDEKYLVSVIVPIYKVERYLEKCVDSILSQTYTNLEVILVDDGSPDRCGEICDEYATKDDRVRVIHRKNGGLSAARNSGMDIATGDFIMFVDSDDWIELDAVAICINEITIEEHKGIKVDVLYFSYSDVPDGEILIKHPQSINPIYIGQVYEAKEFWKFYMDDTWCLHKSVCDKLFRASSLTSFRFVEGIKGEDGVFMLELHATSPNLITKVSDYALYNYRTARQGSIVNQSLKTVWYDAFDVYYKLFGRQKSDKMQSYVATHIISTFVSLYTHYAINSKLPGYKENIDFFEEWEPIIRKMPLSKEARTYRKLRLFQLSPWLYTLIMRLKNRK